MYNVKFATPTLTPITLKSVYRPHNHILRSHISISLWSHKLSNGYLIVEVLDYSVLLCFLYQMVPQNQCPCG